MKILFGINNDDTVKGIASFYEERFKEKIEYKNVYYFKQFIQELQTGQYDRAVVLEELEKFPTNNYAQIDDYLFTNIDNITDVYDSKNLIYIASDRRRQSDEFLSKLFNLGVYTVLLGQDRTKGKVCDCINTPFTKKDVKKYYEDKSGQSVYKSVQVSEIELQRIVSYYKNLNGIADKYNEIFDRISTQYTDEQLKIIVRFLAPDVKQYLSFNNEKYKTIINMPDVVISQAAQNDVSTKDQQQILDGSQGSNIIEIKKEPEMLERIVVREVNHSAPVVTETIQKEVYQSVYEVPTDYKKVVCFIGAPKCGTTFCINAIATSLARSKIKTAIVDMTRKKDSYTIYTYDNEGKRAIAADSLKYASNGFNEPLIYDKLSVYTAMPGEDRKAYNASRIIETVMQNNNVILIDADFTTPTDYFRLCQEVYVVQDMDILNINQITLFLRELKNRGVPMSKIRVIINKHVKCALTAKDILDGIATYTSYDLKMYDELFTSGNIPYYILPFNEENYKKYIEMVFKYSNLFSSFTEDFKNNLNKLINSIYPIGNTYDKYQAAVHKRSKKSNVSAFFKSKKVNENYFSNGTEAGFEKEVK
ncbi:MAG: hypothetical protein PHD15_01560 [Clostridia bacterium]|nr:hypothetical protein [Clostridia bacterium]MDD4386437.1 hypothetical protein [Clostridia bacterium]